MVEKIENILLFLDLIFNLIPTRTIQKQSNYILVILFLLLFLFSLILKNKVEGYLNNYYPREGSQSVLLGLLILPILFYSISVQPNDEQSKMSVFYPIFLIALHQSYFTLLIPTKVSPIFSILYWYFFKEYLPIVPFTLTVLSHCRLLYLFLKHLKRSFSFCEAMILCQFLSIIFGTVITLCFSKIFNQFFDSNNDLFALFFISKKIDLALKLEQLPTSLILSLCIIFSVMLTIQLLIKAMKKLDYKCYLLLFFASLYFCCFAPLFLLVKSDPVETMLNQIFQNKERIFLLAFWFLTLSLMFFIFFHSKTIRFSKQLSTNTKRKWFHALSVFIFVPGVIFQPEFMCLSFVVALTVFVLEEFLRISQIVPFHHILTKFLSQFKDNKDKGVIILSHFHLLIGCAIPVWVVTYSTINNTQVAKLILFGGIIAIGIGDSIASIVGKKIGKIRWYKTPKTVEGTLSAIIACTLFSMLILNDYNLLKLFFVWSLLFLLEAFTEQVDNLVLPIYFISIWFAINRAS
ncbi:dolichol kinase [Anaeramoeba flamelloides]|uniref:dolichol kinase n=1 Tax=Anaeramoeba flamelloides TaxID=1746091 RepID=A0ABQ8ZAX9_9EUKA|nr:dolichol kinase [Anaeramoeba flamelloides]